ncbi:MAG: hypothetical protein ABW026_02285, partial [Microvirga sp.]
AGSDFMEQDDEALGILDRGIPDRGTVDHATLDRAIPDEEAPAAPRRSFPWLRGLILSGIMVAGLVDLARSPAREDPPASPRAVPGTVLTAPAPRWKPLVRPSALIGLETLPAPASLQAREHAGGGREDSLTFGSFDTPGFGRITTTLRSPEAPAGTLFVETVRRAAEAGLSVTRIAPSRGLATKFGIVEAAALTLAGTGERSCQAFRLGDPASSLRMHGWLCGAQGDAVDDRRLACFIDGIGLVAEADQGPADPRKADPALDRFFAEAQSRRLPACGPTARTASALTDAAPAFPAQPFRR